MEIKKLLAGCVAFFVTFTVMDYLLDSKVDFVSVATCTVGYLIGMLIYYKFFYKKK